MASLEMALDLALRGFRIFPLGNDCKPEFVGWPEKATTDEAQIRAWWRCPIMDWDLDRNLGIACGQGLQVVDLDEKSDRHGIANFATVEDVAGEPLPPTLTVRTPSGGLHKFLHVDGAYGNTAGRIALGVDTRGDGGYVVGPGSEKPGGRYEIIEDAPVAPAPQWLVGYLAPYVAPADRREIIAELDTPYAVMRAIEMLRGAEPVTEAGTGNNATFAMAAKVKDLGISRDTAVMLLEQYWNARSDFARSPEELRYVVGNAYRHGRSAPGSLDPAQEFQPVDPPVDRLFTPFEESRFDLSHPYLVEDLLDQGSMSVLYGDSNSGKTFLALDLSHCVATGREWRGKKVRQGLVVYLAAEGGRAIHKRIGALRSRYGAADTPLAVVTLPVDLLRGKEGRDKVLEAVRGAEEHYGLPCVLLVLDTLSRLMAGGNENAPDDMGTLVKNIDLIRSEIRAHVLTVHHSGKNAAAGARGHSLLRAATDTEIEVADRQVSVTKQRDQDYEPAFRFDLEVLTLGAAPDGKAIASCVVKYLDGGQMRELQQRFENAMTAFDRAQQAKAEGAHGPDPERKVVLSTPINRAEWALYYEPFKGSKRRKTGSIVDSAAYKDLASLAIELESVNKIKKFSKSQWVRE